MTISEGRRCALPGCYVVIEPEPDGRPQRKYCTAAHRAVARQMRREGIHRSASAPPLPVPAPPLPLPPIAPPPNVSQRRRQLADSTARRARAMAVLGSAGLLVTGGGLMAASSPIGQPGSTISATPWVAATPEAERNWAEQARVSLASLESQLAQVSQAQQDWNALPEEQRSGPTPSAVRALAARRVLLEQQRATLISELATWDSMSVANRRLADTEAHVARLDHALTEVPRNRALTRPEADTAAALGEQRTLRVRQRDSQREELDSLRQGLHEAMATPLPDDPTATKVITSRVTDLVRHPSKRQGGNHNTPVTGSHRPEITAQREQKAPSRQDVGNGAPPVPGKSKSEGARGPNILAEPGTPDKKSTLGGTVKDTTKPLEHPRAPDGGSPGAGNGGPTDQPVTKPVERTAHDTVIGPNESKTPKTPKMTEAAPSDQSRSTPAPRSTIVPKSEGSGGGAPGGQRVNDANRISGAVSRGNMNDMVSAAMEAKRHEDQAKSSSGGSGRTGRSGYSRGGSNGGSSSNAAADRALSRYGMGGGSKSSSHGRGGSKHSRSSGGSDFGRMIEKYSSSGGGSKRSHGSHGSFFGSSGKSGSKSYKSSGHGSGHSSGHGFGGFF